MSGIKIIRGITYIPTRVVSGKQRYKRLGDERPLADMPTGERKSYTPHLPTADEIASVTKALLFGEGVSGERRAARLQICMACEHKRFDGKGWRCGICGCKLKERAALIDLLRFEETNDYGCHAPGGSKWKAQGV